MKPVQFNYFASFYFDLTYDDYSGSTSLQFRKQPLSLTLRQVARNRNKEDFGNYCISLVFIPIGHIIETIEY